MDLKKILVLSGLAIVMMATAQNVFAEEAVAPVDQALITSSQENSTSKEGDMQWAWGEVTSLDNQAQTVTLKYLDYETDQEKDLVLAVDEKTTFENIQGFNELKLKDTLSIDYIIGMDNKNIAKNISFEKPDAAGSTPLPENNQPLNPLPVAEQPVMTAPDPDSTPAAVQAEPVDAPMVTNVAPPVSPVAPVEPAPVDQNQVQ